MTDAKTWLPVGPDYQTSKQTKMKIEESFATLKKYETIVSEHLRGITIRGNVALPGILRGACLEALIILEGDEEKFKQCWDIAKRENPSVHRGGEFDAYNLTEAAAYITNLARLMQK